MSDKAAGELNLSPVLAGILVAVSLGGLAFATAVGWDILFPAPVFESHMDSSCDLKAGPCIANFGDGSAIALSISPATPAANEPLRLTVETIGQTPDQVSVELWGKHMNMGLIRAPLLDIGHGLFAGDTTLPMCTRRSMTWTATVISEVPHGRYRAGFEFVMLSQ